MFGMGMQELVIIGIIAVLLFGKRLPEVARSLGGSYQQFRKGLNEIHSTLDVRDTLNTPPPSNSYSTASASYDEYDDYAEVSAPKFEPPPAEPQVESEAGEEKA